MDTWGTLVTNDAKKIVPFFAFYLKSYIFGDIGPQRFLGAMASPRHTPARDDSTQDEYPI